MRDPFGRAIYDHYHGERNAPLLQRDGETVQEHPIEQFYFGEPTDVAPGGDLRSFLRGSVLDMGCGTGRRLVAFADEREVVGIDPSDPLVAVARDRGGDARVGDMFALREQFDRDRFCSAFARGTQLGLAGSMDGLRSFLVDLASVTDDGGRAVLDCYDPEHPDTAELLGYRADPTPGLAYRVMHFEYEGVVGETLLFRLFSTDRLREATVPTPWTVDRVSQSGHHYLVFLAKEP